MGDEVKEVKEKVKVVLKRFYVPSKVKVFVVDGDMVFEDVCRFSSDRMIWCPRIKMSFVVPEGHEPTITIHGRKAMITYYFTRDGAAISGPSPSGSTEARAPSPTLVEAVINRRLLEQVFRSLRIDWTTMLTGIFLGGLIVYVITFVLLPVIGIPVQIGRQPVEVVHVHEAPGIVPPGNFTVGP